MKRLLILIFIIILLSGCGNDNKNESRNLNIDELNKMNKEATKIDIKDIKIIVYKSDKFKAENGFMLDSIEQREEEPTEIDSDEYLKFEFKNPNNDMSFDIELIISKTQLDNNRKVYMNLREENIKQQDDFTTTTTSDYVYNKSEFFYMFTCYDNNPQKLTIIKNNMVVLKKFMDKIINDYINLKL